MVIGEDKSGELHGAYKDTHEGTKDAGVSRCKARSGINRNG